MTDRLWLNQYQKRRDWVTLVLRNVLRNVVQDRQAEKASAEGNIVGVPTPSVCPSRAAYPGWVRGQEPTDVPGCDTMAEQAALAALRSAYPALAARYGSALQQARAAALGKLWVALSRERIDGLVPSASAGRATLALPDGTRLSAPPVITDAFAEHSPDLTVTLHGPLQQLIDHPVMLLMAVMASRPNRADTDRWLQLSVELADSVANHALALVGESWRRERLATPGTPEENALRWAARRATTDPGFSPLALFEQAVVDGHPLHPCARVRGGMTVEELFAYAPEWADEVAVRTVAIATSSFMQAPFARWRMTDLLRRWHPGAADVAAAYLRSVRRDPAGYELLPVHPWQLCRALGDRYADAFADGRVVVISGARIFARPLLSLRTLAPVTDRRAAHIKTAVDIRLTTATRVVSPATAHNGPMMSALLAEISRREQGFGGRFTSLAELASGSYQPAPGESVDAAASLAAIARESPERHVGDGEVALPVAALAARSPRSGRPLLADVLDELASSLQRSCSEAAARFLASYCDCMLPALFALLSRWGIALEAHGQNAIVVLRTGLPVRLIYRDFGSIRVSKARLSRSGLCPPALVGALPTEDEDELRAALCFPLVNTNLSQVVAALSRVSATNPGRLWALVARCCRSVYATLTADPAITVQASRDEAVLFGPTLPSKSMLRVQMSDNPHASQWVAVPNPLAAAG
jgi:staphyloferrin A synthase